MKKDKIHIFHILLLSLVTIFLRIWDLGYSHFYGDETKTFYLNKSISAIDFFFSQRKGPIQFLIVWVIEKIYGGYNEFLVRLPFAICGIASVLVFYLYLKKKFGKRYQYLPLISTWVFSVSGFFIAFSRTAQYQSVLILLGLASLLMLEHKKFLLSGFLLGMSLLCHYDGIFFIFPIIFQLFITYKKDFKKIIKFASPFILTAGIFYIPYFFLGHYSKNTSGYISRRLLGGSSFLPNNSLYTYWVYNPNILYFLIFLFSIITAIKIIKSSWSDHKKSLIEILIWFLIPFITFEIIFKNPGTHIYSYVLPLIILSCVGIEKFFTIINKVNLHKFLILFLHITFTSLFITATTTYIPTFNTGYPWNEKIKKDEYQIFLYGFPYNRGWDKISKYKNSEREIKSFYTNDNVTMGEYYFHPIPSDSNDPDYYFHVEKNQEFSNPKIDIINISEYEKIEEIFITDNKTMIVYRRIVEKKE